MPNVVTQNIIVMLDNTGNVIISPDDVDNGSSSVVGISEKSLDIC